MPTSSEKIRFSDLIGKIAGRELTKNELDRYFELDAASSKGFKPRFRVNTETVDVTGVEAAADAAGHALALDAERGAQQLRLRRFDMRLRTASILAEGDSWFSHPQVKTAIDVLQERDYIAENLATAGDTLENMLARREYAPYLRSGSITHFLFSGGGNDVLGELRDLIKLINFSYTDPNNPDHIDYYIKPEFQDVIRVLRENYRSLVRDVRSLSPLTRIVVNGYAYARPVAHGAFLGDDFEFLGFNLVPQHRDNHLHLAWAIVRRMVDQFNTMLENLASNTPQVAYCDLRPAISQSDDADWFDAELHPSRRAAKKIAEILMQELPEPIEAERVA